MSSTATLIDDVRRKIIADPDVILSDQDVMRALVLANERAMGTNVVDLRGIAMDRLEERLDRLEETHRSVLSAAYENVAGTSQVHRAVLRIMDASDISGFVADLEETIPAILHVDSARLVLEVRGGEDGLPETLGRSLGLADIGFVEAYLSLGSNGHVRPIVLRQVPEECRDLYSDASVPITSEAIMKLDLGNDRLPGLLAFGSHDRSQFSPRHGTDLLAFLAAVVERTLHRLLA